ncbi:MAG: hypothetical protein V7K89_06495 [Nostoc sp.]|uniref:hypothetical protein n=1 Tax=Nostoc sp. TaxID=1180 RepID=UPI002FF54CE9
MRNFTVQSLITLLVTSSAFLLTPMRSDAQVNMNRLAQVVKSCQEDMLSPDYYKRMGFSSDHIYSNNKTQNKQRITYCINSRYHYSLLLTKYPWLDSTGEILPGYPGSVLVGSLAKYFEGIYHTSILDCIANQDLSSEECPLVARFIANGTALRNGQYYNDYTVNVCPSCVVAHDEVSGSQQEIFKAFVQWFLTLEKTQRRELISLLGDGDEARELRLVIIGEANTAEKKYLEVRQGVEEQEQERRRQEVLGN